MKKAKFFRYAALALAAVCALTLAGCPTDPDPDPDPDPALINSWTNKVENLPAGLVKEFTINNDFSFTAYINPTFIGTFMGAYEAAYKTKYAEEMKNGSGEDAARAAGDTAGKTAGMGALATNLKDVKDEATRWTVTGKLTADGGAIYVMNSLEEKTGKDTPPDPGADPKAPVVKADVTVRGFNGQRVRITFNGEKSAFNFESAEKNDKVTMFFGGDYTIKPKTPAN
jgi:hypothetical protein